MSRKIYKSAQGKTVDLGALLLQNESVRAVGNMNVNARGDTVDSTNRVIDQKNRQVQRQYRKQTTAASNNMLPTTSNRAARQVQQTTVEEIAQSEQVNETAVALEKKIATSGKIPTGGLAAAIARSREVKQDLEKTPRQLAQENPLRKI
jgi:hypothetical protein